MMKTSRFLVLSFLVFITTGLCRASEFPVNTGLPDSPEFHDASLGKNVFVFSPSMNMKEIQTVIDSIFTMQSGRKGEFSRNRFALLFKPGTYNLDIRVEYYMEVAGLGESPEDVVIRGAVRSNTTHNNSVLTNFWRSVENMTIVPADTTMIWGVSQAAPMRRVHIKGNLHLFDKGYASGGFLADSKIDGVVSSGPQQQWFTRNTRWQKWTGSNWNMVFVGVPDAPAENWPEKPFTKIKETPVIREKPYLVSDKKGLAVKIPLLKMNSSGTSWDSKKEDCRTAGLNDFYIAHADEDNSASINNALKKGKNIILCPGMYSLDQSLKVTRPGTIIMGLGMPSLMPVKGTAAIEIADVGDVSVCGLIVDAGPVFSDKLFIVGEENSAKPHDKNPSFLYDIFFRVGGPSQGTARCCMEINSRDVCVDHTWLWRADHGNGVGWDRNRCANGLIVNGDNVTIYGLFNEHFQEYQTLWNGENGRVYFYQSEMPYDPPAADSWKHGDTNGYASYKISDKVKTHEAWGLGVYNVFYNAPVIVDNAIETPPALENSIHHIITFWLNGNKESVVKSIINGKGGSVSVSKRKAVMD